VVEAAAGVGTVVVIATIALTAVAEWVMVVVVFGEREYTSTFAG